MATKVVVNRKESAEEFDMSRFIALILIPLSLVMQPMPHVHWADGAEQTENHVHHGHVHLSAFWGEYSHRYLYQHEEYSPAPASEEHPHDSDAIYVDVLAATPSETGSLKLLVISSCHPTWDTKRQNLVILPSRKGRHCPNLDLTRLQGSISDVPLFLQGGAFRT